MSPGRPIVLYVQLEETDVFLMRHAFELERVDALLHAVPTGHAAIVYLSSLAREAAVGERGRSPVLALLLELGQPQAGGKALLDWIRNHPQYKHLPVIGLGSAPLPPPNLAPPPGFTQVWEKPGALSGLLCLARRLRETWLAEAADPAAKSTTAIHPGRRAKKRSQTRPTSGFGAMSL